MNDAQETSILNSKRKGQIRQRHLLSWGIAALLLVLLIAVNPAVKRMFGGLVPQIERATGWTRLALATQYLIGGIVFLALGVFSLKRRATNKQRIQGFLDFRLFLGDIGMVVIGAVLLWKAAFS